MYYVRATGQNRFMGYGSSRWLKIRRINKLSKDYYELVVKTANSGDLYIGTTENSTNLEFIKDYYSRKPVSFRTILKEKGI